MHNNDQQKKLQMGNHQQPTSNHAHITSSHHTRTLLSPSILIQMWDLIVLWIVLKVNDGYNYFDLDAGMHMLLMILSV